MTNTLHQLIERAVENGWKWKPRSVISYSPNEPAIRTTLNEQEPQLNTIIFDQEFCKAIWGTGKVISHSGKPISKFVEDDFPDNPEAWQHHLTQLALAPDRLEYLTKWLEEN